MSEVRLADKFEEIEPPPPRWAPLRGIGSLFRGLAGKAGAVMAVGVFSLGFVAVKGHVGLHPASAPAQVALAATPTPAPEPVVTPAPAPPPVVAAAPSAPAPKHADAIASRIDATPTGSIGVDKKKKHKHKHKLDAPEATQPN